MEQRFGRSFADVKVHTDSVAAASAAQLTAAAYTLGNHIVFGAGRYPLRGRAGLRLLAHELTHVAQQDGEPRQISRLAEEEAEVETEEEMEEEDIELERHGLPPRTLAGLFERANRQAEVRQSITGYEIPIATLVPGGKPPDFISVEGMQEVAAEYGNFSYRRRAFHVIDAIKYSVSQANTEADLKAVLARYLGVVKPKRWAPMVFDFSLAQPVDYPKGFDPGHKARLAAFQAAVDERLKQVPALAAATAAQVGRWKRAGRRGCKERPVPPAGENLNFMASLFAARYCRDPAHDDVEWEVTTPTGQTVTYDGKIGDTVYECKCGYAGLIEDYVSKEDWRHRRAEKRLGDQFDEQMRRQVRIADECGFGYRYIVSNKLLRILLESRWPMIPITEMPWDETCG
jgi:hypothetical protein